MKFYIYIETLILSTLFVIYFAILEKIVSFYKKIKTFLQLTGYTADWYSTRGLRIWEPTKARKVLEKEQKEYLEKLKQRK